MLCSSAIISAQEKNPHQLNLESAADDAKYQTGVMFLSLNRQDKALTEFTEYLEIYYNGNHRAEAFKRIAEVYFDSFDYQKAAKYYHSLYEEFSASEEGVEGYYRSGICYLKMGYDERAMEIFKEIVSTHPESSFSYQSQVQLDLMKIIEDKNKIATKETN